MSTELTTTTKDGQLSALLTDMKITGEDECEACFNLPKDKHHYRLRKCGHLFCMPCLKQLIKLCMQDGTFPIPCCKDGCKMRLETVDAWNLSTMRIFQWNDIKYIITGNGNSSGNSYRTCRSSYRVPESAAKVTSQGCKTKICIACNNEAHDG